MDGQSGGALVVLSDAYQQITQLCVLVGGNLSELTPYRKELHPILGGFLLLKRLIPPALQKSAKGKLWEDSKFSIDRLTLLPGA